MATYELKIAGMHCIDCAHTIEAALKKVPGVDQARVHYLTRAAQVTADASTVSVEQLMAAVKDAGYEASPA